MIYLYHWTHVQNVRSILAEGLDPERSTGKAPSVWCVSRRRRTWAAVHVTLRHNWDLSDLVCLRIECHDMDLRLTRWEGVFTSLKVVPARHLAAADPRHQWEWLPLAEWVHSCLDT